jgi:hypothetical protein
LKKALFFTILLFALTYTGQAQGTYSHGAFWGRIVLADTINSKLRWELYLQQRTQNAGTGNIFQAPLLSNVWPWLNYSVSKSTRVSVAPIGYFTTRPFYPSVNDVKDDGVQEYRISLRIENEQKRKLFNYANRFGLEYRMRDLKYNGNYLPNWRARYMLKFEKPLRNVFSKHKPLSVFLSNEVLIQFGEAVKDRTSLFDHNRINFGVAYEVVKNVKISVSYLNVLQARAVARDYDDTQALWMIVTFDNLFSQFKSINKSSN